MVPENYFTATFYAAGRRLSAHCIARTGGAKWLLAALLLLAGPGAFAAPNNFTTNDDSNEVPRNTATGGDVTLNDANPDNITVFTATVVVTPLHGAVALAADGSYVYTPTTGYLGPDSFTYQICQPGGTPACSNISTVALNVYDPAVVCAAATGPNLLANPGFGSGNTGFVSDYAFVAAGSCALCPEGRYGVGADAAGYHPAFAGTGRGGVGDNFMIINGAANITKVYGQTVAVVPNRYYVLSFYANSVNPGSPAKLGFTINGKSVSVVTTLGTTTAYQQVTDVWFSGSSTTATFEIQDVNKALGGNDFGLDDIYLGTCSKSLRVNDVTQSPTIPRNSASTRLAPLQAVLTGASAGVSVLSFTVLSLPTSGTLRLGSPTGPLVVANQVIPFADRGNLFFAPAAGFVGSSTFTYTATDSDNVPADNTATFTVPVTTTNLFVANPDSRQVPQGTATAGSVIPNDLNPDNTANFTATLGTGPLHGTLVLNPDGSYLYTPTAGYLGPDSFTYQICQAGPPLSCSNTALVRLSVYDPAVVCTGATGPNLLANPGFTAGNTGFTSTYAYVADGPGNSELIPDSRYGVGPDAATYHPAFVGTGRGGVGDNFMIVNGSAALSQVYAQTVAVLPNRYYTFAAYATSVNPASPAQLAFTINNESVSAVTTLDGSTTYRQLSGVWFSGSSTSAVFEIRDVNKDLSGNDFGLDDVLLATCPRTLVANDVTQAPAIPNTAAPTALAELSATISNTPATVASFTIVSLPTSGTLRLGGPTGALVAVGDVVPFASRGDLYYTPVSSFVGNATFTYSATDTDGLPSGNVATYTVPVAAAVADVSVTVTGPGTIEVGQPTGQFTANFTNNGPNAALNVTRTVTLPLGSTMTPAQVTSSGAVAYNAVTRVLDFGPRPRLEAGATVSVAFSFTAPPTTSTNLAVRGIVGTDTGQGANAGADFFDLPVVVANASTNRFVTNDDSNEVPRNTTRLGNVIINDLNPDNTLAFTATLVTGPAHGTLTLSPDGSYSYAPVMGYLGPDSFTYAICQGSPAVCSNTSAVALNVYDGALVCSSANGPNLLTNPSFTAGNTAFISDYGFVADGPGNNELVPEALYAVGDNAANYHPAFLGTGRGAVPNNFMIVNGSQTLSRVYLQNVAVIPNRYYTFSLFANSVNPGSPAQLGFAINGKSVSVVTTLINATDATFYQKISDIWFSGTSTTAAFEIRDVNRTLGGNDFGLDDLYFGTCNVNLTVSDVTQTPAISSQAEPTLLAPLVATLTGPGVSIASVVIQTLPNSGTLRLGGPAGPVVTLGQVIPYASRDNLYYTPVSSFGGNATFTYTAIDNEGAGSNNIATFTIPVQNAPLPVQLVSFRARAVGALDARLDWRTAAELNSARFEVERSDDGRRFAKMAVIEAQGTTTRPTDYTWLDAGAGRNAPAAGLYYRLHQVDRDGKTAYSPVLNVRFGKPASPAIGLYPNPATTAATLDLSELPAGTYQVRLLDVLGRTVQQAALSADQHPLDLGQLKAGSYVLLVQGGSNGQVISRNLRLLKE